MPEILIVTVGSNPLPLVVSILALKPTTVYLVYTSDVNQVVERLSKHLKTKFPNICVKPLDIKEHRRTSRIYECLDRLRGICAEASLNYTGGTKLMAVHTRAFWIKHGGQSQHASYLSADGKLYFDDPAIDPISPQNLPRLTLDELCELHFGKPPHQRSDEHKNCQYHNLANRIHDFVCKHDWKEYEQLLPPLYREGSVKLAIPGKPEKQAEEIKVRCEWNAAKEANFGTQGAFCKMNLSPLCQALNVEAQDLEGFSQWFGGEDYANKKSDDRKKARLNYAKWLVGKWLEVWFAGQLLQAKAADGTPLFDEIHQGVEVGEKPDNFEMDVVAVRGHRLFLFSCTVDENTYLVKSKFFEAANRTARIGGEHACAAMVCLHEDPHLVLQTVHDQHWTGYDTLRLFGAPHIRGDKAAPCNVSISDSKTSPHVTLLEGLQEWVLT